MLSAQTFIIVIILSLHETLVEVIKQKFTIITDWTRGSLKMCSAVIMETPVSFEYSLHSQCYTAVNQVLLLHAMILFKFFFWICNKGSVLDWHVSRSVFKYVIELIWIYCCSHLIGWTVCVCVSLSLPLSLSLSLCVCVCVCVRERERERDDWCFTATFVHKVG